MMDSRNKKGKMIAELLLGYSNIPELELGAARIRDQYSGSEMEAIYDQLQMELAACTMDKAT